MSSLLDTIAEQTVAIASLGISADLHAAGLQAGKAAWHAAIGSGASDEVAKARALTAYQAAVKEPEVVAEVAWSASDLAAVHGRPLAPVATIEGGTMDDAGRARSEADLERARAAGFSPAATVYERGLRVNELGVANARASRLEWESKPLVPEACAAFVQAIAAEERKDVMIEHRAIGMDDTGALVDVLATHPGLRAQLATPSRDAFFQLVSRLGYGGGAYLEKCPTELRAANVNSWRVLIEEAERSAKAADPKCDPKRLVCRTRTRPGLKARETFAIVSEGYAPFDADQIARAIARAAPPEARGSVTYDGIRTRYEALFQTTVQPEGFVAGEFFRVGVTVSTGDSGGNAVVVRAVVWQNLCLNLIVIDQATVPVASIRHMGTVMELSRRFSGAFRQALRAIDPFLVAWGYARREDVVERARGTTEAPIPTKPAEAIRGIFAGLLDRDALKVRGKTQSEILDGLVAAWERDESSATTATRTSRAAVANAITRAAHEWSLESPWEEDQLQIAAGSLLWGKKGRAPAPLLYVDPETLEKKPAAEARRGAQA